MKTLNDMLTSKKFLTLLVTCLGAAVAALFDQVSWPDALKGMLASVGVYIGAQGVADGLSGGLTSSMPGTPTWTPEKNDSPKG